jgi:23S rRNA U2552 (ribose-2'-O)-methylase RlmE/FtsJ
VRVLFLLFIAEREREYVCFQFCDDEEEEDLGAWRENRWSVKKEKPEKAREKSEDLIR